MPRPIGKRISLAPSATRDQSSFCSRSTMKIVARSAASRPAVATAIACSSASRWVTDMSCRVMSRMTSRRWPTVRRSMRARRSSARRSTPPGGVPAALRLSFAPSRRSLRSRRSPFPCPVTCRVAPSSMCVDALEDWRDGLGDLLEQHLVAALERPVTLVERLEHADGPARPAPHPDAQHVQRAEAGAQIDGPNEARVGVRVGDVDGLPRERGLTRETLPERKPDLGGGALRDARPELLLLVVDDVDRAALGIDRLRAQVDEPAQVGAAILLHRKVAQLHLDQCDLVVDDHV